MSAIAYPPFPVESGVNFTETLHHDTYPAISPTKVDHKGHIVLITGTSQGVGISTAVSFAKAGTSTLILAARSDSSKAEQEILSAVKTLGIPAPKILKLKLDITNWESVEAAAKDAEKEVGKLDILVNNAGYLSEFVPIVESDRDEYWRNYEVNCKGLYYMTKAFIPLMLKGGEKTVVNLTSQGAHGIHPGSSAYGTTKFAILRFTEYVMVDYGQQGILAYSIHPGGVITEMSTKMPDTMHSFLVDTPEMGSDTICFLTAKRREWLAGRFYNSNWDMTEFLKKKDEIIKGEKLKMRMRF
ncbi:oxidoreductase-like protein [Amylocarpus encephaloides]|uniref:Oxidoreductase-like protein n=1 Tax=Amylocarpus encephaloides TaxID=45428 RepID=A0A9P7YQY2_9HELO|nr:oxidoreductase-like protein [Amylocarpus encephaloides]